MKSDHTHLLPHSWENERGETILAGSYIYVTGTKLILENVAKHHSSNYTCVAENMAGRKTVKIEILVTGTVCVCVGGGGRVV